MNAVASIRARMGITGFGTPPPGGFNPFSAASIAAEVERESRYRVARHAVVALALGADLQSVTVGPDDDGSYTEIRGVHELHWYTQLVVATQLDRSDAELAQIVPVASPTARTLLVELARVHAARVLESSANTHVVDTIAEMLTWGRSFERCALPVGDIESFDFVAAGAP